jgi:hypothetical protein
MAMVILVCEVEQPPGLSEKVCGALLQVEEVL